MENKKPHAADLLSLVKRDALWGLTVDSQLAKKHVLLEIESMDFVD